MAGFPRFRRTSAAFALLASGLTSVGCQSTLLTSAANALGSRASTLAMSETEEEALGAQSYAELLRTSQPTSHPEYQAMVEKVGRRIADVSGKPDFNWEFTVLAGPTQNAFCLPGGKVVVYEGILPLCENEAGLAVVMSHEIAHAIARHGGERMKEQAVVDAVGEVVTKSVKSDDEQKKLLVQTAYGMGSQVGILLPFSRAQETQADSIGLMMMARAGYNPEEAPMFWRRFQSAGKSSTPELLSTHPSDSRRIDNLIDLLSQADRYYAAAPNKLDRGAEIAKLGTTPTRTTVAKADTAAPAKNSEIVATAAFAPSVAEPPAPIAKPVPVWIGAPTAAPAPAQEATAAPAAATTTETESDNPFLAPAATTAPVTDSGWTPTVH